MHSIRIGQLAQVSSCIRISKPMDLCYDVRSKPPMGMDSHRKTSAIAGGI